MSRSASVEECNRRLLRARDAMDRTFAKPLCIRQLAQIAEMSGAHFIRTFRATFGESPHRYLQRRRVERAMFFLRSTDRNVTDVCFDVGFSSLGTFSRTFHDIIGESPTAFRRRGLMSTRQITVEVAIAAPITSEDVKQWNAASDDWHTTSATENVAREACFIRVWRRRTAAPALTSMESTRTLSRSD